jgi:hypothetical protein
VFQIVTDLTPGKKVKIKRMADMARKFASGRKIILRKVKFEALYIILQMKILLMESLLVVRRSLKCILPFILGFLFVISPNVPCAETPQSPWPWSLKGENFRISSNSGDDFKPSVASNGKFYFVVWTRKNPSGYDIFGARIDENGNRMDKNDIAICEAQNDQMFPSIIWNGENFFVAWQDQRNKNRWDIYGALVAPDGTVQKEIQIMAGKPNLDQVGPTLSFDGENHLVVWQGKRNNKVFNIYFRYVSKDGEVLGKPIQLSSSLKDETSPAVSFDGENYLIVWQDKRKGKLWDIYGARVSPSGDIPDPPIQLTFTGQSDRWNPVLSWNGNHYLVVWESTQQEGSNFSGRRVIPATDGLILDLTDITIQGDGLNRAFPSILWDGSDFLLVWTEKPEGESKIYGASIQSEGRISVSESGPISTPGKTSNPYFPEVALLGDEALIVWQEGPNPDNEWNIFGQIITKAKSSTPDGSNLISGQ